MTLLVLSSALLLGGLGGCATQSLNPGTGDISFRLKWQGEADLDLHVVDPTGRHTGVVVPGYQPSPEEMKALLRRYKAEQEGKELEAGGVLDVDCNASPDRMCQRPIENIFWAPGTAPGGEYRVWAVLFQRLPDDSEVRFDLEIRRGESVVANHSGILSNERQESDHFSHAYGRP